MPAVDEFGSLLVLSFGVSMAIAEASAAGNAFGVILCVLSVLAGATQLNVSSKAMSEKLDSVQLAFFTAPITSVSLAPVFFIKEYSDFVEYFARERFAAVAIVLAGSAIAAAYNVVHYAMVGLTDPVTTCVLGQIKVIAIMVLSAFFLGMYIGTICAQLPMLCAVVLLQCYRFADVCSSVCILYIEQVKAKSLHLA